MDWVTAVLCGVQEQENVRLAIMHTEISTLYFKLQMEEKLEQEGKPNIANTYRECLKLWQTQLAQFEQEKHKNKIKKLMNIVK